jgi:hypothetical protein
LADHAQWRHDHAMAFPTVLGFAAVSFSARPELVCCRWQRMAKL